VKHSKCRAQTQFVALAPPRISTALLIPVMERSTPVHTRVDIENNMEEILLKKELTLSTTMVATA
jgi:hypothetical protein